MTERQAKTMKSVKRIQKQIPETEYFADIHITQEESTTRYNIYGRLLDKNGIQIPGIKTKRRTAHSWEAAEHKQKELMYVLSCLIPTEKSERDQNKKVSICQNEIDRLVSNYLQDRYVFHTLEATGSKKTSWNSDTHKIVYQYWLNNRFSEFVLSMGEEDDLRQALDVFRQQLINQTSANGRSGKRPDRVAQTVDTNLNRMTILLRELRNAFPNLPEIDFLSGFAVTHAVPEEQIKALPEEMCQKFCRTLEQKVESDPAYVIGAVLMLDGGLRTAEAAGIKKEDITLFDDYAIVTVLRQEKNGERTDQLKTDNAYRIVILSFWAKEMIRKCGNLITNWNNPVLVESKDLSKWIRERLYECNREIMNRASSIEKTNPDTDANGIPQYDIGAYVLRRNAASRWLNHAGLSEVAIDRMLGHVSEKTHTAANLLDETDQHMIADWLERYVYATDCTRNPGYANIQVQECGELNLIPYNSYLLSNESGKPIRLRVDVTSTNPNEEIKLDAPHDAIRGTIITRSLQYKPNNRVVFVANVKKEETK